VYELQDKLQSLVYYLLRSCLGKRNSLNISQIKRLLLLLAITNAATAELHCYTDKDNRPLIILHENVFIKCYSIYSKENKAMQYNVRHKVVRIRPKRKAKLRQTFVSLGRKREILHCSANKEVKHLLLTSRNALQTVLLLSYTLSCAFNNSVFIVSTVLLNLIIFPLVDYRLDSRSREKSIS